MAQGHASFYFPSHHFLRDRLDQAIDALEQQSRYTPLDHERVFIGYSQGATMGALVMPHLDRQFAYLLLIEGGFDQWPIYLANKFRARGGRRVFFVCGTRHCAERAHRSVVWLTRAGIEADYAYEAGAGHTPTGRVAAAAARGFTWLTRDASWRQGNSEATLKNLDQGTRDSF